MENHQVDLPEKSATSRRQLLSSLIAGGAFAAAAPLFASRASAAEEGPTTTVPPNRDAKDNDTLNAALNREAQMVATYAAAVAAVTDKNDIAGLTHIHDHHVAYVQAIKGYLGTDAVDPTGSALASFAGGSFASIANQLASLENATAAVHTNSLNSISGLNAVKLVASIITVEARHAAALAVVAGASPLTAAGN